jgi:hypothetical protein
MTNTRSQVRAYVGGITGGVVLCQVERTYQPGLDQQVVELIRAFRCELCCLAMALAVWTAVDVLIFVTVKPLRLFEQVKLSARAQQRNMTRAVGGCNQN